MVLTTTSNKEGNFICEVKLYDNGELKVIITRKFTRSQYLTDLNKGCILNEKDAQEKLKNFAVNEAENILKNLKFERLPIKVDGYFSACWEE